MEKLFIFSCALFIFISCKGELDVKVTPFKKASVALTVAVSKAMTESVGSCSFLAASDLTNTSGFSYRINFSKAILSSSFTVADIANAGTGGISSLNWTLTNCGDNKNFKLTAASINGSGTVIPTVMAGAVVDIDENISMPSISIDNVVTFDNIAPTVIINQSIVETIGSCVFGASADPTDKLSLNYKITFSKIIEPTSFIISDISNNGTGGGTLLTWVLTSCGDDKNFKLTATHIKGDGTIVPSLVLGAIQDLAGNTNLLSSATDNSINYFFTGWKQQAYIKAVNNNVDDEFSNVSLDGNTLAVAAKSEDSSQVTITNGAVASSDNLGINNGAVYVYTRSGNSWTQEAYIKASNSDNNDEFGTSLSLSENTLAVGAANEASNTTTIINGTTSSADNSSNHSGAVYIYKRSGSAWSQEAYIKAVNSYGSSIFSEVSISGNTLVVGAYGDQSLQTIITNGTTASSDHSGLSNGAAYIYKRTGTNWVQEAYIKAPNNHTNMNFGQRVSLDGDTVVIGTSAERSSASTITSGITASSDTSLNFSGAVYVYKRSGNSWMQEAYIKAVNNKQLLYFGSSVSLNGNLLAVGASGEPSDQTSITNGPSASSNTSNAFSGAVYIYKRTGTIWSAEAYIKASNNNAADYFGSSVSLNGDTLAVGARGEDSNFNSILTGEIASSNNSSADSGAVYIYKRSGGIWTEEAYIKASNNTAGDKFGEFVSLSGDTLAVGAPFEDSSQNTITNGATASIDNSNANSGAVYIYSNDNRLFNPAKASLAAQTTTSIMMSWASAGLKATGYKIAYSIGSTPPADCSSGTVIDVGNVLTYNIASLASNTHYSFRICSYDSLGNTSEGYTTNFSTASATPEVASITTLVNSHNAITLTWPSAGGLTSGYKIAYALEDATLTDCNSGIIVDAGNVLSYQVINLLAYHKYIFRVCSYDSSAHVSYGRYTLARTLPLPSGWYQEAYIKAANNDSGGDAFGSSMSIDGDTIAVGATLEDSNLTTIINGTGVSFDNSKADSGAVYVYKRTGDIWAQEAYIKSSNADAGDSFGTHVSVNGDTLAIGASNESSNVTGITNGTGASMDNSAASAGAVYIYKRTGNTWEQEVYIKAYNADIGDNFGFRVSLSEDTLAVGAPLEDSNQTTITSGVGGSADNSIANSGAVYVYKRNGAIWSQEAYIKGQNPTVTDVFSFVSLNKDTLAVGVNGDDSSQTGITNGPTATLDNSVADTGAVFIYKRTGSVWVQEAYIKASNAEANDQFGHKISLNEDSLAVGVVLEDSNQTSITDGDTASTDNNSLSSGAVYIFKRTGVTWVQEAYIKAKNNDAQDQFGYVSISGNTLVVGAPLEDSDESLITNGTTASADNNASNSGAVYVYKRTGSSWAQEAFIKASNNVGSYRFGLVVGISGDTIATSSSYEASAQTTITNGVNAPSTVPDNMQSGAVYVYRNISRLFDIREINSSVASTTATLKWTKSSGSGVGYIYAYDIGPIAPINCSTGTVVDVGNVVSATITGLTPGSVYSFRLCSYDDALTFSSGTTKTIVTLP
jgi:hypothetical protein